MYFSLTTIVLPTIPLTCTSHITTASLLLYDLTLLSNCQKLLVIYSRHTAFLHLCGALSLSPSHTSATGDSFHGDRRIIKGCRTPSSPLYGPDVHQRPEQRRGKDTRGDLQALYVCVCVEMGGTASQGMPKRVLMSRERVADCDMGQSIMVWRTKLSVRPESAYTHSHKARYFYCRGVWQCDRQQGTQAPVRG